MKYGTFKEFVRDAFYHGTDANATPINKHDDNYAPYLWQEVQKCLDKKLLDEAERIIAATYSRIEVAGVITYLPTEADVKAAYEVSEQAPI